MNTYQMIKSLPAKGFDWAGFTAALRAEYLADRIATNRAPLGLEEWDSLLSSGKMRDRRRAAWELACCIVGDKSRRSNIIPPSEESRMWDSFEGGHWDVWTDAEAEELATQQIADMIKKFH